MENLLRMWTNGVWLRQMDWMSASVGCVGTLVHDRFLAERGPHPPQCAHWGTFPPGEGSGNAVQFCRVVPPKKPSPGGKVAAKQTNEGYLPKAVRSVLRQPRTVRDHESNPFGEAKHHKTRKALPIRESLSYLSISANGEDLTPRTGGWRGSGRRCRATGPRWSCLCSPGAWPAR